MPKLQKSLFLAHICVSKTASQSKCRRWRRFASFDTAKIGYARVSTNDQNLDLQTDVLKQAGCKKIFSDHGVSRAKAERPGLDKALDQTRKEDTLVIWKLDRLGCSLRDLLSIVEGLKERGANPPRYRNNALEFSNLF